MTITVVENGKKKALAEFLEGRRKERVMERKSIRWVLFAVRIMRENFPQKVTRE